MILHKGQQVLDSYCDATHLNHILEAVWKKLDNHNAVKKIDGDAVWRLYVIRAAIRHKSK